MKGQVRKVTISLQYNTQREINKYGCMSSVFTSYYGTRHLCLGYKTLVKCLMRR